MNYPVWQLDMFGGGLLVVLIAVFHVYIAHFAVGGGLFLVLTERKAQRENNPAILAYVHRHARFFLVLTMVAGAISGVGIWFIISLLNPAATSILIHTFVFFWASEWVFFLIEIVALFLYAYTFGRMTPQRHQALGWIYFGAAWMSLFFINGIIGFMLTPGDWLQNGNIWAAFFNPSFWPALFFRTFFALIIAGLFGMATASWIKEDAVRITITRYCARWLLLPFLFFLATAFWYRAVLPPELDELIFARMPTMRLFIDGFFLCGSLAMLGGLLLAIRMPAVVGKTVTIGLLMIGLLFMGCFEFIREGGRRPYIIRDYMYSTSILRSETPELQKNGLLATARWVRHRQVTQSNLMEAGREVYNLLCLSCHAIGGPMRDIKRLAAPYTPSGLDAMISGMDVFHPSMPPFAGNVAERKALATFIAVGLLGRQDPEPTQPIEKTVEIPPFSPETDPYILLAWSPSGMRYVAEVTDTLSILPPGNGLRAQLILRGETPEIINQGVTISYRLASGVLGFDGKPVPSGTLLPSEDLFIAEGIHLSPLTANGFDPYPVMTLEARDETDTLLASTKVVAPVSTELGCSNCHGGTARSGEPGGLNRETAMHILQVHDRLSGTTLAAQASMPGKTIRCQSCHADLLVRSEGDKTRLNLSASIHGFHAHYLKARGEQACMFCHPSSPSGATRSQRDIHASLGMGCTNCHGTLEQHALSLLKQEQQDGKARAAVLMTTLTPGLATGNIVARKPWVQQPDCLHCHVNYQPPETDTISNARTGGEQELYRNRTDDSGRLFCAACHSSPHALYPAHNPHGGQLDSLQPLQYQGNHLPLGANRNCSVCHTVAMEDEMHHINTLRSFRNE